MVGLGKGPSRLAAVEGAPERLSIVGPGKNRPCFATDESTPERFPIPGLGKDGRVSWPAIPGLRGEPADISRPTDRVKAW